jgi:hypothetical protein
VINRDAAPGILTLGLALGVAAVLLACVSRVALDESAVQGTARTLLGTERVEEPMRARTAAAIAATVPGTAPLGPRRFERLVRTTVEQPEFLAAFRDAVGVVHRHVFVGETGPIVLEPENVRVAIVGALDEREPDLGGQVPATAAPVVTVDSESIPDLDGWAPVVRRTTAISGVLAGVLLAVGLALSERRARAVARIGRWATATGVGVLVFFWLLPRVVAPLIGGWTEVGGGVVSSSSALLVPALVLIAVGVAVIVLANRVIAIRRDHALAIIPRAPTRHATGEDQTVRDSA